VVVLDGSRLEDFDVETSARKQIKGNIYLAKVIRVEPSLQAAFVDYGGNRHGFLAFSEIHPDYYQIPVADRQRLLAMAAEEEREATERAEAETEDEALAGSATDTTPESADEAMREASTPDEAPEQAAPQEEPEMRRPAMPLEITPIEIISAPPPENESEVEAAPATPEAEAVETVPAEAAPESPPSAEAAETEGEQAARDLLVEEPESEEEGETALAPAPESLGGDSDDAAEARELRQRQRFLRNYKIQEVIHRRQIMLVQVVKEERGNKGAALTTYLSLAGRFSVLMPNSPTGGGVSRKITSLADRRRLNEAVAELDIPQGMGLIVRTAGANRPKPEIKRDCEYLLRLWDDIRERTMQSIAPALIYEEANLIKRAIRDVYTRDVEDIQVDGEEGYRVAHDFMRMLMPSQTGKVRLWTEGQPLFAKYQVEAQLDAMLTPIVQLRSGGYLVINQTEALVAIDVNSGRSTRERSVEDTALRTNLEAADEVARQLRLRDLAGLIVIDFIDMESRRNNLAVERRLKEALKNDRARIQVGSISHFGLMEMSRQRLRASLAEAALVVCPHCNGMGHVRSPESAALHVLRAIEDEGVRYRSAEILVSLPPDVALYLLNHKRDRLADIEQRYGLHAVFNADAGLAGANFRIEKTKTLSAAPPAPRPALPAPPPAIEPEVEEDEEETEAKSQAAGAEPAAGADEEGDRRRRRRRRRRGRRGETGGEVEPASSERGEPDEALEPHSEPAVVEEETTEIDIIMAATFGASEPEEGHGAEAAIAPPAETAQPEEAVEGRPRRRRTRSPRRRAAASTDEAIPAQPEAEHASAEAAALAAPAPADQTEPAALSAADEPEQASEPPSPEQAQPAASEPAVSADETPAPVSAEPEPMVKPKLIDAEPASVEKKRGWWRVRPLRRADAGD
jgi:ribonuclease E